LVEYALILALIAVVAILVLQGLGGKVNNTLSSVNANLPERVVRRRRGKSEGGTARPRLPANYIAASRRTRLLRAGTARS